MIKPIETHFNGYRFRSRLEARWAVFFDALKLKWEYEPEGFHLDDGVMYLPDFKVEYPGRDDSEIHHEWFEVKGNIREISLEECRKIVSFGRHKRITILDGVPRPTMFSCVEPDIDYLTPSFDGEFVTDKVLKYEMGFLANLPERSRSGYALWSNKGRLWWDEHQNYFAPTTYFGDNNDIEIACEKAKSARFEHGENRSARRGI